MESTIICLDNSEWTRNGDYTPNRFQAQADAVNLLAGAKTEANPENTVGVLTMAGKTPRILVTPTTDLGKILNSMQVTLVTARDSIDLRRQLILLLGQHLLTCFILSCLSPSPCWSQSHNPQAC